MTNIITLETIQARQDELVAMIAAFSAAKTTINLPAATIELQPGERYAGLVLNDDGTPSEMYSATALSLLKELVGALDKTYWFDPQLNRARNFIAEQEATHE